MRPKNPTGCWLGSTGAWRFVTGAQQRASCWLSFWVNSLGSPPETLPATPHPLSIARKSVLNLLPIFRHLFLSRHRHERLPLFTVVRYRIPLADTDFTAARQTPSYFWAFCSSTAVLTLTITTTTANAFVFEFGRLLCGFGRQILDLVSTVTTTHIRNLGSTSEILHTVYPSVVSSDNVDCGNRPPHQSSAHHVSRWPKTCLRQRP